MGRISILDDARAANRLGDPVAPAPILIEIPECLRVGTGRRLDGETLRSRRGSSLRGEGRSGWEPRTPEQGTRHG